LQALIFSQLSELVDFIKAFEKDLSSSPNFTLWGLSQWGELDDQGSDPDYLVLSHYRKTGLLKDLDLKDFEGKLEIIDQVAPPINTSHDQVIIKLSLAKQIQSTCRVRFQHKALSLQSLLPLQTWQKGVPTQALNHPVLFWIDEPSLAAKVVTDHFKITNDHMEYIVLQGSRSAEQQEDAQQEAKQQEAEQDKLNQPNQLSILLKIHQPSYFLIQRYAEQYSSLKVFYSLHDDLFLEWQYEPILADRWTSGLNQDPEQFSLVSRGLILKADTFNKLDWSDIYELTSFDLDHAMDKEWSLTQDHDFTFNIPLSLEPKSRPLDAELWLMNTENFDELEQKVSLVDEEDLSQLLISVQQKQETVANAQPDQQKTDPHTKPKLRFFVKERQSQLAKSHLDFGGQSFASYMGFHNLYLPVDYELQPRLRRDQYPKLFNLKNGELTVLSLVEKTPHDHPHAHNQLETTAFSTSIPSLKDTILHKFNEQSFEPFSELVHYIVSSEIEHLDKAKKNTKFNLNKYKSNASLFAEPRYSELKALLLPLQKSIPDLKPASPPSQNKVKPAPKTKTQQADLEEQAQAAQEEETTTKQVKSKKSPKLKVDSTKQSKKHQLETRASQLLSTLLSKSDQNTNDEDLWGELVQVYEQLKDSSSALEALTEFFWHSRQEEGLGLLDSALSQSAPMAIKMRKVLSSMSAAQFKLSKTEQKQLDLDNISAYLAEQSKKELPFFSFATACYYFAKVEALANHSRYEPLSHLLEFIQSQSSSWRKKERWLLILGMAKLTQDQRLLAQHREALLDQINFGGLERRDLPNIVVGHLTYTKAKTSHNTEQDHPHSNAQDLKQGLFYLELIEQKLLGNIQHKFATQLTAPLYVLLARISHEYQLFDQRDRYLKALLPLVDQFELSTRNPSAVWVLILLTRSKGLIDQKIAGRYNKVLPQAIDLLEADEKTKFLTLLRETLKRGQHQRNKDRSMISRQESKNRLFLSFKPENYPEINELFQSFLDSLNSSQKNRTKEEFSKLIQGLNKHTTPDDDHQLLAYYLHQINEVIGKVKWLIESHTFIDLFSHLDKKLVTHLKDFKHPKFFINLCILTISELQIRMGNTLHAQNQIEWLLESLNQSDTPWIDYLDNSAMALQSIESVEYGSRAPLLEKVLDGLNKLIVGQASTMFVVYFLEQVVEVAMNTDQLVANRFQDHIDLEELSLRDALLHDQL
jgi:hypothetical protein